MLIWVGFFMDVKNWLINLSNFNTENVDTMECMFYGCNKLANLDLVIFYNR